MLIHAFKTICCNMTEDSSIKRCDLENNLKNEDINEAEKKHKPDTLFLIFTVLTGILLMLVSSATSIWTSPAVVKMQSDDPKENILGRPITTVETSLLLGIPGIVSLIGACFLPKLADFMGRKKSLQVMGLGIFLGIIGLAFSETILLMIVFISVIQTFCSGIWGILPVYLTEICEDHNRAKYGCLMTVFSPVGQLYGLIVGPLFNLHTFTLLLAAPLMPFLFLFFFAPESPTYLVTRKKYDECLITLKKLRNNKSYLEIERDYLKITKHLLVSDEKEKFSLIKLINTKECRIGLLLALLPILVQCFCGVLVITPLLGPIFNDSGSNLTGDTIAIIVSAVKLATFTFTTFVVETTGRKPMLITSAIGSGISATSLGVLFYLKDINSPIFSELKWAPLVFMSVYIISYSIGLGPIPMAIMSELFTSDIRSTAITVVSAITNILMTVYIALYPILAEMIGTHWCMWMFACSCFLGSFLIFKVLPEIRGKSIEEIQGILNEYTIF